LLQNREITE